MTFMHKGEQFIGVACGGNFQINYPLGDAVFVFGLPGKSPISGTGQAGESPNKGRQPMEKKAAGQDTTGAKQ
jgi:hypothetical protein